MLKLGSRLSISIQHRVFFIPLGKRHSTPSRYLCAGKRDYSSGLSRYVPKQSRKTSEESRTQPVDIPEKSKYVGKLDHSILRADNNEDGEETFLDLQEKNDDGSGYMDESFDDFNENIMSLEKGVNASMLGSEAKGDNKFLDLQEKKNAGCYMSKSFNASNSGIMNLEKGLNPSRWDHSVYRSKVKSEFKEAGQGTSLHLQDKDKAEMYSDVSCDEFSEELENSNNNVGSSGYKPMRQHKIAYDIVKQHIQGEQVKSKGEACKTKQEAENMAIRYLGLRAYTAAELTKKLIGKQCPPNIVHRVINDFQLRGFISDSLYAESFSQSRWSSRCWAPKRIKQALLEKGISNQDSEAAIKLVFEKGQYKEGDVEHGLSKEAIDQLYSHALKRWLQGKDLSMEKRKARVTRWLQYRGHSWGVVTQILKRLPSHQSWTDDGNEEPKPEPMRAEPKQELSKEAMDQLYVQASKRWLQGKDLSTEKCKARVIRWLQYRGHKWDTVSQFLKRLESDQSWIVHEDEELEPEPKQPESKQELSKEALDQLYVQASKRWQQGKDLSTDKRKARVIRWLQYRGHKWDMVSQFVKRLGSHQS